MSREPGSEDIYLSVGPSEDGFVRVGIYTQNGGVKIFGFLVPPSAARSTAEKLTLASFTAEEHVRWRMDQEGGGHT